MAGNLVVGQSGGPTAVINASLAGVIRAALASSQIDRVLGAVDGSRGLLNEELIDLGCEDAHTLGLLSQTPGAALGTSRLKLKEEHLDRLLSVFKAHDVRYFCMIGGNDSMDTAHKVEQLAKAQGYPLRVVGVPKTIDNDLGDEARTLIDHTPGYGSCARYWANLIRNVEEENRAMRPSECVSVLQAMGRDSGFITAAARLGDPGREFPLMLFLPEAGHSAEAVCDLISDGLRRRGRVIAVVPESLMTDADSHKVDGFGHVEYGASKTTAAQTVVNLLNSRKLPVRGQATGQVPGVLQRCVSLEASDVDREEAYELGRNAVQYALSGVSGRMATILRVSDAPYAVRYGHVPLEAVANAARRLPPDWVAPGGTDVTDGFIRYARPLIGGVPAFMEVEDGLPRFARLNLSHLEKKLPAYTPCGF